MDSLQEGPFKISEVLGPVTYKLQLPIQWNIHNMFDFLPHITKPMSMERISLNHHLTLSVEKKNMK